MFAEKVAGQFYERFPETLKNALNFRVQNYNHCFSKVFEDHKHNNISEQNISHVMDGACMLQLTFINLSGRISPELFDVTK